MRISSCHGRWILQKLIILCKVKLLKDPDNVKPIKFLSQECSDKN